MDRRPVFLTFADYYLPGYKAGGPIRAISNLVNSFAGVFQFDIVTRDRDLGDNESYPRIAVDQWCRVGEARVHYLSRRRLSVFGLLALIQDRAFDAIYLNSFFSSIAVRVLLLRRFGLIPSVPVILAPRGEFSPSALQFKGNRKHLYIALARMADLCRNVTWQASSEHELRDIFRVWDTKSLPRVEITPEMLADGRTAVRPPRREKVEGYLEAAIILRISDKKNLDGALRLLFGVRGNMTLSIYGPIEDPDYWIECQKLIAMLPSNVKAVYHGALAHEQVHEVLASKDLFFFPTIGENFGHAIVEALEAGCPVLISDRTPWRDLSKHGLGWDIPLSDAPAYHAALETMIAMNNDEHSELSENAVSYVAEIGRSPEIVDSNRYLFSSVAKRTG